MSDTVAVLGAAFGGGLVGAILQPMVSYAMERIRSGEEIRKRRERSLRRWIEAMLSQGAALTRLYETMHFRYKLGLPSLSIGERAEIAILHQENVLPFQPQRIGDASLRKMAVDYNDALSNLWMELSLPVENYGFRTPSKKRHYSVVGMAFEKNDIREFYRQLIELTPHIILRMDELNWPEVDD